MHIYFPTLYDVKLLMSTVDGLHGGLQRVAEDLKVERIGPMHQAGSDSLLTNTTFFRLAEIAFQGAQMIEAKYRGEIYGLGQHAYRGHKADQNQVKYSDNNLRSTLEPQHAWQPGQRVVNNSNVINSRLSSEEDTHS